MVASASLGFRFIQYILFPSPINDVVDNFVDDIIEKGLAQEAIAMSEHIVNIKGKRHLHNLALMYSCYSHFSIPFGTRPLLLRMWWA